MENNKPILITPAQALKILPVGRNTLYEDLLKREDFPCTKIGAKYYINLELLQEWANKQCAKK